mgnify:CR=1 FL=1
MANKSKEAERQNDIKRWVQKESRSSNWRNDLSEVMTDDIDSKPIKEKNVKNGLIEEIQFMKVKEDTKVV